MTNLDSVLKSQRHYFVDKGPIILCVFAYCLFTRSYELRGQEHGFGGFLADVPLFYCCLSSSLNSGTKMV